MGSISSYNIAGLISEDSEEVAAATQIRQNCRRQEPHSRLRSPPRGTPASIRIHLTFPETRVIGLNFSLHVWVYLHSDSCSGLQKAHLFCTRVRFGRLTSFKVTQGRWFWYQSKALVGHCDYGPILHRFWDNLGTLSNCRRDWTSSIVCGSDVASTYVNRRTLRCGTVCECRISLESSSLVNITTGSKICVYCGCHIYLTEVGYERST